MGPHQILHKNGNLEILIDAKNFSEIYDTDPNIKRILSYSDSDIFDFIRTQYNTGITEIDKILHFDNDIDEKRQSGGIKFYKEGKWARTQAITPVLKNIEMVGKKIFHKDSVTAEEWEKIWYVFVHHALVDHSRIFDKKSGIYVTEDADILKNRLWFETHFPGTPLNIATIQEAMEIMDLFAKNLEKYQIRNFHTANPGLLYWMYFRIKLPHYNVQTSSPTQSLETLSSRFIFLFRSLDEMGFNYFSGVNKDTGDSIQYHFNYFITLITGIFDNLASETKNKYNIQLKFEQPSRISLSKDSGRDFLNELRNHNQTLRDHISNYAVFINLIYELRDTVIHRDFQRPVTFSSLSGKNEANLLRTTKEVMEWLKLLKDKKSIYDEYSEWGAHPTQIGYFLSPYDFSKKAFTVLIQFVDEYLSLLEFEDFIGKNQNTRFVNDLLELKEFGLRC